VQGLAGELTRFLDSDIAGRLARDEITPTQARALNELSHFTGSAIRAAGNPNDPMYAFAQDYLGQLLGPGETGTTGGSGNPLVDPETQQQITWMRDAIDAGQSETAAGFFNDIVERRAAANPTASRTDIGNQLIRQLGIKPDTLGFVVSTNGNVTVTERVDRPTAVARLAAAYWRNDPTLSQQEVERAANAFIDQRGIPAMFPERLMLDIVVKPTGIDRDLTDAERALREARASNDPVALRNAATTYNNLLLREAAAENLFFRPTPFTLVALGLINPDTGKPATAQDFENRVPHMGPGTFAQSYYSGQRGLTDPNADWIDRSFYTVATGGVMPLFLLEEMGRGLLNAPNAADRMMQYIERASLTTDADERILSSLQAVHAGTEVILGVGVIVPTGTAGGIATNELRTFTSLGAARESFAEAVESSGGLNSGMMAGQRGAIDVVAILDSGRLLIQRGEQFFEFLVSQRNNRIQFTLTRDLTVVVDDVAPNRGTTIQTLTPGQIANVERRMNTFDAYVDPATGVWTRNPTGVSDAAYTLERNLIAEGKLPPGVRADYTPHHLTEFDPGMGVAQRILNRFGINPNEAANGVWLDRSYHRQVHTGDYQAWVTDRLQQAERSGGGREGIVQELQRIAEHLRQGKPIPPKPK
jgi:A nuclease family of the HNH/ENDO VII superfamily with conserved AHH